VGHDVLEVARATLVSQLQYASPARLGFLISECSRLQAKSIRLLDIDFLQRILHQYLISFNQSSIIHTTFFINYTPTC